MTTDDSEHVAAQAIAAGDFERAVELLRPLAEQESQYALVSLGWIYENSLVQAPEKDIAQQYYQHAAILGSASAHFYLGRLLIGKHEPTRAKQVLEIGAKLGSNECKSELIRLTDLDAEHEAAAALEAGDFTAAARILMPLTERGSQYALLSMGWLYETGANGSPNNELARFNYQRAVNEGSASACFELGRLFAHQNDETQARSAFKTGAERGDISCMARLGRQMVEGRGGPVDTSTGLAWLESAAEQGHIQAQRTLLGIRERDAKTLGERLAIKKEIAILAKKGASEMLRDPHSNKVR